MKRFFSLLMMALCLLIGFQQILVVVHFKLNQEAIEHDLCINRDQPELQCHGICQLKKRLQEAENTENATMGMWKKVDILPICTVETDAQYFPIDLKRILSSRIVILYVDPYIVTSVLPPIV